MTHDIFIKGCQVNFSIEGPNEAEVESLYPEETYRTLDECFGDFLLKMKNNKVEEIPKENPMVEPLAITATCA